MFLTRAEICSLDWRKSRRSIGNGDCVEIAPTTGDVVVRDSKDTAGPVLRYSASVWRNFLAEAKQDRIV